MLTSDIRKKTQTLAILIFVHWTTTEVQLNQQIISLMTISMYYNKLEFISANHH